MNIRIIVANCIIGLLLSANIALGVMISYAVKPQCIVDGCTKARCEQSFYCKGHSNGVHIAVVCEK